MKLYKVTIIFRDFDFIFKFSQKSGINFWDSFSKKFGSEVENYSVERKGATQSNFYAYTDSDVESLKALVAEMLSEVVSGASEDYVISVSPVTTEEAERLSDNNIGNINDKSWFADYMHDLKSGKTEEEPSSGSGRSAAGASAQAYVPPEAEEIKETAEKTETPAPEEKKADQEANKPEEKLGLSQEIEKILECKRELLSRVRGQRHAVEEVLNTVFECDAFSSNDEKHSGPLASFLFTGPSGVGKTFLAKQCEQVLKRPCMIVDMSEYSSNLSHGKFNGDYGHRPLITNFVRENPNCILVFDEIEKAHINTIHLFLRILDEGTLTDERLHKDISFRNTIIILTTNAGRSLYDDTSVCDLSSVPRRVILEALRKDINPATAEPYFPECIVTRFANGHVVLFNHLEPYALMEIIRDEIALQVGLFNKSYGISVNYSPDSLAALVLYSCGGVSDARTLRGIARQIIVKELQDCVTQTYKRIGEKVNMLKTIEISIDLDPDNSDVSKLFVNRDTFNIVTFCGSEAADRLGSVEIDNIKFIPCTDPSSCKKLARGAVDFVIIDPTAGQRDMESVPYDVEDIKSDGMDMFEYYSEYYPEIPIYILNTEGREAQAFDTLSARGARGIINFDETDTFIETMKEISFHSHINNAVFSLGRSGKVLNYNALQYSVDDETAVIMFSRLGQGFAKSSDDEGVLTQHDKDNGVMFDDIVGCKAAKEALKEFCGFVSNPRRYLAKGKSVPTGVLLYGPPGTGKTMLAKAMANEAGVAFIPITATTFFGPYVGQSEHNIREAFRRARKYAPSILFIDEVDAIARRRTGSDTTVHFENALNALIAEMDGFSKDEKRPVFILAATNYDISGASGKVLDSAFIRRFDKRIYVDLPDKEARYELCKKLLERHEINFGDAHESVLQNLAQRTSGMSNADLDKIINMFLNATDDSAPSSAVLMDMVDTFRYGEVKDYPEKELRQTACHESGHALVSRLLGSTPLFLTVVSRSNFGGYMEPEHAERGSMTYSYLMNRVCSALAGRIAEIEVYGKDAGLNTGASSDIEMARTLIKAALDDFAMGDNLYSKNEDTIGERIMQEQYARTAKLISDNRATLERLTDLLVQKKSLDQHQLETFFESESV